MKLSNRRKQELLWIFKEKYREKWHPDFLKDAGRLLRGEPVDYIIGWTPFLNCKIDLSYKPLIPRPETEYWTEQAIRELRSKNQELRILDLFAGSGCIGIAMLKNIKNANVDFADVDPNSIAQTKLNLQFNKIRASRYRAIRSDVWSNLRNTYDYIFANPPYIPVRNKQKVQRAVLRYEPHRALFGGGDGLYFIKKFLRDARRHLKPNGIIFMEFDSSQKNAITKLLRQYGYTKFAFLKDQYGKWRLARIAL